MNGDCRSKSRWYDMIWMLQKWQKYKKFQGMDTAALPPATDIFLTEEGTSPADAYP